MICRVCKHGLFGGCVCTPDFPEETTEPEAFNYSRAVTTRMGALSTPVARTRYDWPDDPAEPGEETKR